MGASRPRALLGLRRDPARPRELLGEARARYAELKNQARAQELDGLTGVAALTPSPSRHRADEMVDRRHVSS